MKKVITLQQRNHRFQNWSNYSLLIGIRFSSSPKGNNYGLTNLGPGYRFSTAERYSKEKSRAPGPGSYKIYSTIGNKALEMPQTRPVTAKSIKS